MKSKYFLKLSAKSTTKNIIVNFSDYGKAEKIMDTMKNFPHIRIVESGFIIKDNPMDMNTIGMVKYHGQNILQDTYRRLSC
jgi:hypothetical protein